MKTQYYTASSLDGFVSTDDDSVEWLDGLGDPTDSSYPAFIADVGAIAMGSATYEWILRHITPSADAPAAPAVWPYRQPTWVFTTRELPRAPGADIRFVHGDVRAIHAEMQAVAHGKNVWVAGGGGLAGQFHDAGLLDEIIVQVGSVVLGSGKPLLPRHIVTPPLVLESVRQMGASFVELRYRAQRTPDSRTD